MKRKNWNGVKGLFFFCNSDKLAITNGNPNPDKRNSIPDTESPENSGRLNCDVKEKTGTE
ncbi:MAG TPA: hypothetical protein VGK59_11980 [Ohtaekwangia sp.]